MTVDDPTPSRREMHWFATDERRRGRFRLFPPATRVCRCGGLIGENYSRGVVPWYSRRQAATFHPMTVRYRN